MAARKALAGAPDRGLAMLALYVAALEAVGVVGIAAYCIFFK